MILYLDTSTPVCKIWLDDTAFKYETNRDLAKDLLRLIVESLSNSFSEVTAIAVFRGPGSFTGLRIGATVANTLADQLNIPIVATTGRNWRATAKTRLTNHENDQIVLPLYNKPANTTSPRK